MSIRRDEHARGKICSHHVTPIDPMSGFSLQEKAEIWNTDFSVFVLSPGVDVGATFTPVESAVSKVKRINHWYIASSSIEGETGNAEGCGVFGMNSRDGLKPISTAGKEKPVYDQDKGPWSILPHLILSPSWHDRPLQPSWGWLFSPIIYSCSDSVFLITTVSPEAPYHPEAPQRVRELWCLRILQVQPCRVRPEGCWFIRLFLPSLITSVIVTCSGGGKSFALSSGDLCGDSRQSCSAGNGLDTDLAEERWGNKVDFAYQGRMEYHTRTFLCDDSTTSECEYSEMISINER